MNNKNGFTLIELIMIIVLVGVVFPLILGPFMTSVKEVATPAYISQLTMLAKGVMEEEMDDIDGSGWGETTMTTYSITVPADVTPTVTRELCDYDSVSSAFTCPAADDATALYLFVTVQVQDTAGNGPMIELQALKVKDY